MATDAARTYEATQENTTLQPTTNHGAYSSNGSDAPLEKDFSNGYHLDSSHDPGEALNRIRTTGSLSISPELFEKIYLSPQNKVAGELRKTFGNPTPVALAGFIMTLTPLSCTLMGWRGAGGSGAANIGTYFFFGGLIMVLGATGEWIVGNTFPCVVFYTFGAFWLVFGATLTPFYNSAGAYATGDILGTQTTGWNATFGFFLLWMGVLCFIYMICALRTNVVFFLIFTLLVPAFACLAAAYWHLAIDPMSTVAPVLQKAGGALAFVTCLLGWWIFAAIMLAALDFPFQLPVGDLSQVIKGASEKEKMKQRQSEA